MKKTLLTITLFWVKLCFKMCKGDDQEELREIVRILEKQASNMSIVSQAKIHGGQSTVAELQGMAICSPK